MVCEESQVWRQFLNTIYIIPLNHLTTVLLLPIQPSTTFQNASKKKICSAIGAITDILSTHILGFIMDRCSYCYLDQVTLKSSVITSQ